MKKHFLFIGLLIYSFPGSLPGQPSLDPVSIDRLYYTAKVWGFLKYFHPQVAAGYMNWDSVLIQTVQKVRSVQNDQDFNSALLGMITQAGPVFNPYPPPPVVPPDLQRNDLTWLTDRALSATVRAELDTVRLWFRPQSNYYVGQASAGNPVFENDKQFYKSGDTLLPSAELRLLALFRYWNIINYFFPYKNLMDQKWDVTLKEFIPKFWQAGDGRTYHTTMLELATRINDACAAVHSSIISNQLVGTFYLPLRLRFVGTETVVAKVLGDTSLVKPGDVIRKINGIDIRAVRDSIRLYTESSNAASLASNINNRILLGRQSESVRLLLEGPTGQREVVLTRIDQSTYNRLLPATGPIWKKLLSPDSVHVYGYVDMGRLTMNDVPGMFNDLWSTEAIIFDCRSISQGALPEIVRYLFSTPLYNANLMVPDVRYPGTLFWMPTYIGVNNLPRPYDKAVTILINEETTGQAEYTAMTLELFSRRLKIGSQTAGAVGDVSSVYLPGGIVADFSGLGVFYRDGRSTRRIGILTDLDVRPTIAGIRQGRDEVLETALEQVAQPPDSLAQLVWNWQTPFPRWNDLRAVFAVSANTIYAVGELGTILKTTNGGRTWIRQGSGTNANLWGLWFTGASTGFAVGDLGTVVRTNDGGQSWLAQTVDPEVNFYGVCFTDASTGTAVGYPGAIYRTTDGGNTWALQLSGPATYLRAVHFTDAKNGTVVGSSGTIFKTTNGGSRWNRQLSGLEETDTLLSGVSFTDALRGTIVGHKGTILRTTNGGTTWTMQQSGTSYHLYGVTFTDANTGMAVGDAGTVLRTTDGGTTWTSVSSGITDWFSGASFIDGNTGTIVGSYGTVLRTTDGGSTWTLQTTGPRKSLYGVQFTDALTGTVVGYRGSILRTNDGGATWLTQSSPTTQGLWGISFPDPNVGIAVGEQGTIIRTTNAGTTWNDQTISTSPGTVIWFSGISFGSPTTGVIVGRIDSLFPPDEQQILSGLPLSVRGQETRSIILHTTNGGMTWNRQILPKWKQWLTAVSFGDANTATAVGDGGYILRTTDGGATWIGPDYPNAPAPFYGVSSIGRNIATLVGDYGTIVRTTNGGKTWVTQQSGTYRRLNSVWFVNELHGLVVGDSGMMLVTNNGGTTWLQRPAVTTKNLYAAFFSNVYRGYVVGDGGTILSTAPGGIPVSVTDNYESSAPREFALAQNYPNPFNGTTNFELRIANFGFVTLKVFDLLGREVATLVDEERQLGVYRVTWNAAHLPSGVYFYRLRAGEFVETRKCILVK